MPEPTLPEEPTNEPDNTSTNEATDQPVSATEPDHSAELRRGVLRMVPVFLRYLRSRLSLEEDNADPDETIEYIRKGVEFKGTNVWILVFAILIASIGLNMNSPAVVIGAMLISPLMGPIMGVGMGVGINDFELIKKSAYNLGLMVGISVITSMLYFYLTPFNEAQSELLSRTQPTIWDVMIGLFGGLAGIVAGSRKEKSNAIPGVAIATALMPPLCTAGFGLATGNLAYFFGAFYLFTINSVFISLSTFMIVRFLRYPTKAFVSKARETQVKRWIGALIIVITLPSAYIAFNLVRESVIEREAMTFVNENFLFDQCQVISKSVSHDGEHPVIEVALLGEPISDETLDNIKAKMKLNERLALAELIVRQGPIQEAGLDRETVELMNQRMRSGIIEDLYKRNEEVLQSKDEQIEVLQNEVLRYKSMEMPVSDISNELRSQHPAVTGFSLMQTPIVSMDSLKVDTVTLAVVSFPRTPSSKEKKRLEQWLKARTKADSLKVLIELP